MARPPLAKIKDIRGTAASRRNDSRFIALQQACNEAIEKLDGDLYGYAARAAVAELMQSWLDALIDDDDPPDEAVDIEEMIRKDITRTKERLNHFVEIFYPKNDSTPHAR